MKNCPLWGSLTFAQMNHSNRLVALAFGGEVFMYEQRKTDLEDCTRFRADRFIRDGGQWYFSTREGSMEGPFAIKLEAENRLELYKKVMASGFLPSDTKFSI